MTLTGFIILIGVSIDSMVDGASRFREEADLATDRSSDAAAAFQDVALRWEVFGPADLRGAQVVDLRGAQPADLQGAQVVDLQDTQPEGSEDTAEAGLEGMVGVTANYQNSRPVVRPISGRRA